MLHEIAADDGAKDNNNPNDGKHTQVAGLRPRMTIGVFGR
jgi:hypothetical protein